MKNIILIYHRICSSSAKESFKPWTCSVTIKLVFFPCGKQCKVIDVTIGGKLTTVTNRAQILIFLFRSSRSCPVDMSPQLHKSTVKQRYIHNRYTFFRNIPRALVYTRVMSHGLKCKSRVYPS